MDLDEMLKLAKSAERVRMTADGIVCPSPCFLLSILMTAKGRDEADAGIYDGDDTVKDEALDLYINGYTSGLFSWSPPLYFRHGIYLDFTSDLESVVFQFIVEPTP